MTDNFSANAGIKLLRSFCALIDWGVYALLGFMYEIFFNVASADLFANESVLGFYKRVQLIIGVYMVFQLAILIMKGIFNTDNVSGKNNNEFVKRIIIALVMLTVMTPISIPNPQNEYETQINNNGLLFGTLYSLQYRILNNNTIGRLVLGTDDKVTTGANNNNNNNNSYNQKNSADDLTRSANVFTSTILKGFIRINLVPEEDRKPVEEGKALETLNANRMCKDIDEATLNAYVSNDTPPGDLLSLVTATCTPDTSKLTGDVYKALTFFGISGKTKFVFSYMMIVSTVVGVIFIIIMVSFTIDIAVRAIKLAVLRLIAPIPIISYMDPNGSKDGGFNSWVKTLTQTYIDLFIRLASVYFVIYLIQDMIANGIYMNKTADAVGIISFIFICIGLFYFAKEAPKFLQQAMGMKSEPMNIFGTAMGRAAALASVPGSFAASRKASYEADVTNYGKDAANGVFNRGKHLLAGFAGGLTGLGAGLSAAAGAKDHQARAVMEAMQKRNAMDINRGKNGSTLLGRTRTMAERMAMGEDSYERMAADARVARAQEKTGKDLFSYLEGKGKTDGAGFTVSTGNLEALRDAHGQEHDIRTSLNEAKRRRAEALAKERRDGVAAEYVLQDSQGNNITVNAHDAVADKIEEELSYAAGTMWAEQEEAKGVNADMGYTQKRDDYATVGGEFSYSPDANGVYSGVSKLKKAQKKAGGRATHIESSKEYMRAEADHGATGGKK